MSNSVLAGVDLGDSAVWINEFEGSDVSYDIRYTEDGRKCIDLKHQPKSNDMIISCGWRTYADIKVFNALKNGSVPTNLTLADGRVFNVLIKSTDTDPATEYIEYVDTDELDLTLTLIEF